MNTSAPQACVTPIQLCDIEGVTKPDSGCRTNINADGPTKKRKLRLTNMSELEANITQYFETLNASTIVKVQ
jgi:hypothetical protein